MPQVGERNAAIVILGLWFLWAVGQDAMALAQFRTGTDYHVFWSTGRPWLFFMLAIPVLMLDLGALIALGRASVHGHRFVIGAAIASIFYTIISGSLLMHDLDGVRAAYEASREARGLPVRPEVAERVFQADTVLITLGVAILLNFVVAVLGWANRGYFRPSSLNAGEPDA